VAQPRIFNLGTRTLNIVIILDVLDLQVFILLLLGLVIVSVWCICLLSKPRVPYPLLQSVSVQGTLSTLALQLGFILWVWTQNMAEFICIFSGLNAFDHGEKFCFSFPALTVPEEATVQ